MTHNEPLTAATDVRRPDVDGAASGLDVDGLVVAEFNHVLRSPRPWSTVPVGFSARLVAEPLATQVLSAMKVVVASSLLHVSHSERAHRPLVLGEHVEARATSPRLWPAAGGVFAEVTSTISVDNEVVVEHRDCFLLVNGHVDRGSRTSPRPVLPRPPRIQLADATLVGTFTISSQWILRYVRVAEDHNPVHRDVGTAQSLGFTDVIAPGWGVLSRSVEMIRSRYLVGVAPATVHATECRFAEVVLAGQRAAVHAAQVDDGSFGFVVLNDEMRPVLRGSICTERPSLAHGNRAPHARVRPELEEVMQ